jgi:hypothetical protein
MLSQAIIDIWNMNCNWFSSWGHCALCFTHPRHLCGQQTDKVLWNDLSSVIFAQSLVLHYGFSSLTLVPPKKLTGKGFLNKDRTMQLLA